MGWERCVPAIGGQGWGGELLGRLVLSVGRPRWRSAA